MAETAKDKIIRYLEDLYAAEQGGIKAMQAMLAEATDPDLKSAVSEHLQVTESAGDAPGSARHGAGRQSQRRQERP